MFAVEHWNAWDGPLFESDSNKRRGGGNGGHYSSHPKAIIEVRPAALGQIWHPPGDHIKVGDMNRCILHLTKDWNGLGKDYYSSWTRINAGGLKCSHY